jgi:hypothetical protein
MKLGSVEIIHLQASAKGMDIIGLGGGIAAFLYIVAMDEIDVTPGQIG